MRETQKLVLHRPTELFLEFRYAERPAWVSAKNALSWYASWYPLGASGMMLPPTLAETTPDELG